MFSPGAEMSGYVDWSPARPREEKSETVPSRVPVVLVVVKRRDREDARRRVLAGRVGEVLRAVATVVAVGPHGHHALVDQSALELGGRGLRVERAAAGRPVGVAGHLDRRAGGRRDAGTARGPVVLEHPVERGAQQAPRMSDAEHRSRATPAWRRARHPGASSRRPAWSGARRRCRSRGCRGRPGKGCRCRPTPAPSAPSTATRVASHTVLRFATTALLPSASRR